MSTALSRSLPPLQLFSPSIAAAALSRPSITVTGRLCPHAAVLNKQHRRRCSFSSVHHPHQPAVSPCSCYQQASPLLFPSFPPVHYRPRPAVSPCSCSQQAASPPLLLPVRPSPPPAGRVPMQLFSTSITAAALSFPSITATGRFNVRRPRHRSITAIQQAAVLSH